MFQPKFSTYASRSATLLEAHTQYSPSLWCQTAEEWGNSIYIQSVRKKIPLRDLSLSLASQVRASPSYLAPIQNLYPSESESIRKNFQSRSMKIDSKLIRLNPN